MNTTTVRVTGDTHARLRRLQEAWQRRRGERLAQSELVARALEYAERHADVFVDELGWRPWSAAQIDRFLARLPSFDGPPDLSRDIDHWLYGTPEDKAP